MIKPSSAGEGRELGIFMIVSLNPSQKGGGKLHPPCKLEKWEGKRGKKAKKNTKGRLLFNRKGKKETRSVASKEKRDQEPQPSNPYIAVRV